MKIDKNITKKLIPYIQNEKRLFLSGFLLMLMGSVLKLLDPLIIAHIIDNIVPAGAIRELYLYAFMFIAVILISGLTTYWQVILLSKMGIKIITKIKMQVFDHFLHLPIAYFDHNPVGELIARVESDCENVKQLFSEMSVTIVGNMLFFIGMVTVLLWKNYSITLILLIPVFFIIVSVFFVIRYVRKFFQRSRELNADITGIVAEYIQGISLVQLFNQQDRIKKLLADKGAEKKKNDAKSFFIEYSAWGFYGFLMETGFIVLLIYLMVPKIFIGLVTIGTLIVFIQYTQRIFHPLMMISENLNQIQRAFVSLHRIFGILALSREQIEKQERVPVAFDNTIEFKDVSFQYKEDEWVLQNINVKINKGEKIALVGASGSGKTTFVSLLCGFYPISKGRVLVDGVDLREFALKEWRKIIGLVQQDIHLFPGDVKENIRIYDDSIGEDEIKNAISVVGADDIVAHFGQGIDSEIKERGQNISVGEKQVLSFARAIVFSPELLILDEATASVDVRTEVRIQKAMQVILQNKTAVIVAHRLSSIMNADKIIVFDKGRIIAQGTHLELLDTSFEYKKMVELQFVNIGD